MKKLLLTAFSVCYAALACAQSITVQDTTVSETARPRITAADGQSIGLVNTVGTESKAKVSAGDTCPSNGFLTEGTAGTALLTCVNGQWRDFKNLEQAVVQMTIDGSRENARPRHIQYQFDTQVGIPTLHTTEEAAVQVHRTESGFAVPSKTADSLYVDTNVLAFNSDNTVHVLIELSSVDAGHDWSKRVDVTLPVGVRTMIAKDAFGDEYAIRVTKRAS
jgi:hypothetical protein